MRSSAVSSSQICAISSGVACSSHQPPRSSRRQEAQTYSGESQSLVTSAATIHGANTGHLGWEAFLGVAVISLMLLISEASAAESQAVASFHKEVQPILTQYCSDCHADGSSKGGIAFDELKTDDALLNPELWLKVLKNLRAGIMPPEKKPRPTEAERQTIERWIKYGAFAIDPNNPDPGRVTLRRLNRVEYRNTIRDLAGFDFKADEEFPPDDTGYGFDNIGDVLTVSPLLLEKYMDAAKAIVAGAVPKVSRLIQERTILGREFLKGDGSTNSGRMTLYKEWNLSHTLPIEKAGTYRLALEVILSGSFGFDPHRAMMVFRLNDRELLKREVGWDENKKLRFEFEEIWQPGDYRLGFELHPIELGETKTGTGRNDLSVDLRIAAVTAHGPVERDQWVHPKNFELFFTKDAPELPAERLAYAKEVIARYAKRAFRQPVDERTVGRLAAIAENAYTQPGKTFEEGIGQALIAVLASPRFLFRVENSQPGLANERYTFVDEYALATRLSYFLWSTMPDDELFRMAETGSLRKNLSAQVKRMLDDPRSEALIQNFTGQWLQARDVDTVAINARAVLAKDDSAPPETGQGGGRRGGFGFRPPRFELDRDTRQAMRRETEMFFASVVREDRSVKDLIDSDYTFLNEKLARHYSLTNLNVVGPEMRRITLPTDHPRGGVLTQGTVLTVTSNPTRTSPVKRGLFILENILGTPAPPPPDDIPLLEDAEKQFKDREPTLREVLELHRSQALCSACHSRMDPLGLALESFNALGLWREKERGQPIDPSGRLITGESFTGIRELKRILANDHRLDFYRCLTEKLMTYALGRGPEYYDVEAIDRIVGQLDQSNGRFSILLTGVIESAPFQKRRAESALASAQSSRASGRSNEPGSKASSR